jgi:hypothetical protein
MATTMLALKEEGLVATMVATKVVRVGLLMLAAMLPAMVAVKVGTVAAEMRTTKALLTVTRTPDAPATLTPPMVVVTKPARKELQQMATVLVELEGHSNSQPLLRLSQAGAFLQVLRTLKSPMKVASMARALAVAEDHSRRRLRMKPCLAAVLLLVEYAHKLAKTTSALVRTRHKGPCRMTSPWVVDLQLSPSTQVDPRRAW